MNDEQLATDWTSPHRLTCDQLADALADNDVAKHIKRGCSNGEKVYDNILAEAARRLHGLQQHKLHRITRILSHYDHAREKHPYFCDRLLSSTLPPTYREEVLSGTRRMLLTQQAFNQVYALSLLECEEDELKLAISRGDISNAIEEVYDCIAVLLRVVDVLEGRQPLGRPEDRPMAVERERDCRPATEDEVKNGKAAWCHVCQSTCINRGKDAIVVCSRFTDEPPEQ